MYMYSSIVPSSNPKGSVSSNRGLDVHPKDTCEVGEVDDEQEVSHTGLTTYTTPAIAIE